MNHLFVSDDGGLYDTRQPNWSHKPIRENFRRNHREIETVADLKATLRAGQWTDVGGYPLYLVMADGEALSFDAARSEFRSLVDAIWNRTSVIDGWRPVACEINYEDGFLYCSHTGNRIPSAYAEDERECGQCEGTGRTQSASNLEEEECPVCDGSGKL